MTVPSAPSNLTATTQSDSRIDLDWDAVNEPAVDQYNVYRDTSQGVSVEASNFVSSTGVNTTSYSDVGLSAGTTYYYVVTAVDTDTDPDDESSASNEASATTQGQSLEGRVTDLEGTVSQNETILRDQDLITDAREIAEALFSGEPDQEDLADLMDEGPPETFYIGYHEAGRRGRPDGGPGQTYGWGSAGQSKAQNDRDLFQDAYNDATSAQKDEWFPASYSPSLGGTGLNAESVGDRGTYSTWKNDWGPVHGAKQLTEYIGLPIKTIEVNAATQGLPTGATTMLTVDATETLRFTYDSTELTASQAATAASELETILENAFTELKNNHNSNWSDFFGFTDVTVTVI